MACFTYLSSDAFWSLVTAVSTAALAFVAWRQFHDLNRTNHSEFLHKLKSDFFTKEARELLILIEIDALTFKKAQDPNDFGFFEVEVPKNLKKYLEDSLNTSRKYYSTQEVDDFLLGHLEDVGLFLKNNAIGVRDADQQFEYYVKTVWTSTPIQDYIKWTKAQADDNDIYSNLHDLYSELERFETNNKKE